jgi:hypothetical protein
MYAKNKGCCRMTSMLVQAAEVTVFVIRLSGTTTTIKCLLGETAEQLKRRIQQREGIPLEDVRVILSGKELQGQRTLRDYGVCAWSTLQMILRLKGC